MRKQDVSEVKESEWKGELNRQDAKINMESFSEQKYISPIVLPYSSNIGQAYFAVAANDRNI